MNHAETSRIVYKYLDPSSTIDKILLQLTSRNGIYTSILNNFNRVVKTLPTVTGRKLSPSEIEEYRVRQALERQSKVYLTLKGLLQLAYYPGHPDKGIEFISFLIQDVRRSNWDDEANRNWIASPITLNLVSRLYSGQVFRIQLSQTWGKDAQDNVAHTVNTTIISPSKTIHLYHFDYKYNVWEGEVYVGEDKLDAGYRATCNGMEYICTAFTLVIPSIGHWEDNEDKLSHVGYVPDFINQHCREIRAKKGSISFIYDIHHTGPISIVGGNKYPDVLARLLADKINITLG